MKQKTIAALALNAAAAVLLVIFVAVLARPRGKAISSASFETVSGAVLSQVDTGTMQEGDNQMLRRLYRLSPEDFDGFLLYYPTSNMGAEELLLLKLKDLDQQESVTQACEARRATQMASFDGYAMEQYAMEENAILDVQGNYVLFISASDPAGVDRAFREAL